MLSKNKKHIRLIFAILVVFNFFAAEVFAEQVWKHTESVKTGIDMTSAIPSATVKRFEDGRELITVRFGSFDIWEYRHLREVFHSVEFSGCGYYSVIGEPDVPIWSKIIKLAPGEKLVLENVEYKWSDKELYGRWMPAQKSYSDVKAMKQLAINRKTYQRKDDVFAGNRISLSQPRQIWNNSYLTLSLQPFKYFPAEGRIFILQEARISLRRINSPKNDANKERVVRRHSGYLIITPNNFLKTLAPFINFKKKRHPELRVVTTEEIGNTVEAIDKVIEKEGSRGTRFVLLVGHSSILPSKAYKSPWNESGKPDCFDADYVYRNHGNNIFPSYHVGRFPVTSEKDLETVIAKTLRRWKNPEAYQTRPMLIAHEEEAPGKYQGCVQGILNHVIRSSKVKLAPKVIFPASIGRGGLASRKEDFYQALSSGVGTMLYRGHGGTDFLATKYLDYWGSRQKHWYEMETAVPPIFYSVACLNGQLTDASGKRVPGLCENLLNSSVYGVSAALGAIQPSPTIPNHTFAWNLMYYTYVEPMPTISDVFHRSVMETMKYGFENNENAAAWTWMGDLYNLYGDPELPVTGFSRK